jgi:hypothetical protein
VPNYLCLGPRIYLNAIPQGAGGPKAGRPADGRVGNWMAVVGPNPHSPGQAAGGRGGGSDSSVDGQKHCEPLLLGKELLERRVERRSSGGTTHYP